MSIEITKASYKPFEDKMKSSLSVLESNFNTIRAGRANPKLLDGISVSYYGVDTPLQQVANVQVPEARSITITPWESKMLSDIERAIQAANLGINPLNDGKCIRLNFPPLTEDRRRELTKDVNKLGEEAKIAIRQIRREALEQYKAYEKDSQISEDEYRIFEEEVQKLTDTYVEKIDEAVGRKNKDVMEL